MSLRDKLKATKSTEPEGEGVPLDNSTPVWSCGELPIIWSDDEIKRIKKRTLRDNYKRGVIPKEIYKVLLNGNKN